MNTHLKRGGLVAAAALCLSATTALSTGALSTAAWAAMPASAPAAPQTAATAGPMVAVAYDYTVYQVQSALNARGYDAGPEDGLMGSRTRSAITAYQQRNDLLVTGQASQSLLAHIQGSQPSRGYGNGSAEAGVNIRRSQRVLRRLGYEVEVTGRMDAQTADAIRDYQRDNNLLATGELTAELQSHLRDNIREARQERRDGRDTGSGTVSATTLAEIQRGLRARGYDIASASGSMDDKTEAAIRAYQRDSGLRETGRASSELAELLSKGLAEPVSTPDNIRQVQTALNARGYDAGPEDGVLGPSTRSAIRSYRANTDLPDAGGLDRQLLTALGVTAGLDTGGGDSTGSSGSGSGSDNVAEADYRLRIGDDFNDGNYVGGSRWSVIAGNFQVDNGALRSRIETGGSQSQQELGREMIQGVLGQVLGVPVGGAGEDAAAISQDTNFGNAFRLSMRVAGDPSSSAKMNIGPYKGRNVINGYRLVYDAQAAQPLSIVASTEQGTRTTVASGNAPNLSDGQWHNVVWSRSTDGEMLVTIDDTPYLSVTDRGISGSNTGLSFVNLGGDWKLDDIAVESPSG